MKLFFKNKNNFSFQCDMNIYKISVFYKRYLMITLNINIKAMIKLCSALFQMMNSMRALIFLWSSNGNCCLRALSTFMPTLKQFFFNGIHFYTTGNWTGFHLLNKNDFLIPSCSIEKKRQVNNTKFTIKKKKKGLDLKFVIKVVLKCCEYNIF